MSERNASTTQLSPAEAEFLVKSFAATTVNPTDPGSTEFCLRTQGIMLKCRAIIEQARAAEIAAANPTPDAAATNGTIPDGAAQNGNGIGEQAEANAANA